MKNQPTQPPQDTVGESATRKQTPLREIADRLTQAMIQNLNYHTTHDEPPPADRSTDDDDAHAADRHEPEAEGGGL